MKFRYFPIKLYIYLFGAAGMGYTTCQAMQEPTTKTLIFLFIFSLMMLSGHFFMRPMIKKAKEEISELSKSKLEKKEDK
ncbi:hypothetical protein JAB4_059230 (plasmid) [Janthinobacterium sp. HH102]|uniref:hypothetical protein n=1 Tax=Janthinobacterium sp. HH102 TaxID=1537274 RepID=UPI000874B522|nr:hypothetical protein [Janthinobacterium sp. HH102]QOU76423.1 hypothetical protein JAB4_059230 [Janthinobacterium sp. HH102]